MDLTQIETIFRGCPALQDTAIRPSPDNNALVAHIVAKDTAQAPGSLKSEVQRYLISSQLPRIARPRIFILEKSLPLTENGKLDTKRLSRTPISQSSTTTSHAQWTPLQNNLCKIWAGILNCEEEDITLDASFESLGGDSQNLVVIDIKLNNEMSISNLLEEQILTKKMTLDGLAKYIEQLHPGRIKSACDQMNPSSAAVTPFLHAPSLTMNIAKLEPTTPTTSTPAHNRRRSSNNGVTHGSIIHPLNMWPAPSPPSSSSSASSSSNSSSSSSPNTPRKSNYHG